ncbi:MAG: N-6 DNA methylase [Phycisphaerae bacterium]|jgi:type I restriction enzyme M protein
MSSKKARLQYSSLFELHASDLKSEAQVETRLLAPLFSDLGYPASAILPKKKLKPLVIHDGVKTMPKEVDFLLLRPDKSAKVVVDAKVPNEDIFKHWGQVASYALSYNRNKKDEERIKWLLISNGHITCLFKHDSNTPIVTLKLSDFTSGSPPYVSLRGQIKYHGVSIAPSKNTLQFESIVPEKLNRLFQEAHDYVWKKEKLHPVDAFFEFCKFIFLKIREDKKREVLDDIESYKLPMTTDWLNAQSKTSAHPVRDVLFQQLRNDLEDSVKRGEKRRIFDLNETLKLSAGTCKELIRRFEKINLSSIDEDLNGRMFEVFLNAAVRGKALGQYFTPRSVVDFMTRIGLYGVDVATPPRIIDACCGTGGFLIEAMAHLLSSLRNDTRFNRREKEERRNRICNEMLFGVDANERVARIARINMYLHGDGGSHIFCADGLDREQLISDDMADERRSELKEYLKAVRTETDGFDLVLTNPPFSMSYQRKNEDEERILSQREIANGRSSAKSNSLFLDRYHEILKCGGEMLIVIDDTVLNGDTCVEERKWILDKFIVLGVHSLPFNAFFKAQANIKTSILHLRKKKNGKDVQGHVFMSISNNIGHDNGLNDTPERNNLPDILAAYFEWKRTGRLTPVIKPNQSKDENLECSEQIWLVAPNDFKVDRIDAFAYAPELANVRADLLRREKSGEIKFFQGKNFALKKKLSKKDKKVLSNLGQTFKYIEISDVTKYGLIVTHRNALIEDLPTRAEFVINQGDVLFAINNSSRGTVVIVPKEFDGALCTSGFYVIEPNNSTEGLLLWYSLRSEPVRKQIYYLAKTASQPELKMGEWREKFIIPIPIGNAAKKAIQSAKAFQSHLSALLNADNVKLTET